MENEMVEIKPSVPGIGVSGVVMCPLFRSACMKQGCEFWTELFYEDRPVGRCALAWTPKMMIELRESIDKLIEVRNLEVDGGKTKDVTKSQE